MLNRVTATEYVGQANEVGAVGIRVPLQNQVDLLQQRVIQLETFVSVLDTVATGLFNRVLERINATDARIEM